MLMFKSREKAPPFLDEEMRIISPPNKKLGAPNHGDLLAYLNRKQERELSESVDGLRGQLRKALTDINLSANSPDALLRILPTVRERDSLHGADVLRGGRAPVTTNTLLGLRSSNGGGYFVPFGSTSDDREIIVKVADGELQTDAARRCFKFDPHGHSEGAFDEVTERLFHSMYRRILAHTVGQRAAEVGALDDLRKGLAARLSQISFSLEKQECPIRYDGVISPGDAGTLPIHSYTLASSLGASAPFKISIVPAYLSAHSDR